MPPDLLESTLFGHVKGAFTSAIASKKGLFEIADRGTLFLDEIGTMSLDTQSKILRVLQDRKFMHLGGVHEIQVDVRIIAATNVDLKQLVREGKFRDDLFYRLNVITIDLPPLRQRKEDIPLLVDFFLSKYSEENERPRRRMMPEALRPLLSYSWPGNVRELENVVERAVVLSSGLEIGAELLPDHQGDGRAARGGSEDPGAAAAAEPAAGGRALAPQPGLTARTPDEAPAVPAGAGRDQDRRQVRPVGVEMTAGGYPASRLIAIFSPER